MKSGFWGRKIGMTQLFIGLKAVPVTVIDTSKWIVTQIKTREIDGYIAVQVGLPRKRYLQKEYSSIWLQKLADYFQFIREIKFITLPNEVVVGQVVNFESFVALGDKVDVTGTTKGCGFQGVVKRHSFVGGKNSHGCAMGDNPGSVGGLRTSGKVLKGKKLPGRMGNDRRTICNLEVIRIDQNPQLIIVKGSVPGRMGSLLFVGKRG